MLRNTRQASYSHADNQQRLGWTRLRHAGPVYVGRASAPRAHGGERQPAFDDATFTEPMVVSDPLPPAPPAGYYTAKDTGERSLRPPAKRNFFSRMAEAVHGTMRDCYHDPARAVHHCTRRDRWPYLLLVFVSSVLFVFLFLAILGHAAAATARDDMLWRQVIARAAREPTPAP